MRRVFAETPLSKNKKIANSIFGNTTLYDCYNTVILMYFYCRCLISDCERTLAWFASPTRYRSSHRALSVPSAGSVARSAPRSDPSHAAPPRPYYQYCQSGLKKMSCSTSPAHSRSGPRPHPISIAPPAAPPRHHPGSCRRTGCGPRPPHPRPHHTRPRRRPHARR